MDHNVYNLMFMREIRKLCQINFESPYASKLGSNKLYLLKNFVELNTRKGTHQKIFT